MIEKRWKQKTFTKRKNQQLFTKKDFFFFSIFLRFYTTNLKEFHSTTSYLCFKCTTKTYEIKEFSLANDAETHSSTKSENERDFFYLNTSKARKEKYRQAKNQKKKFWPRSQITKNQVKNHTLAIIKTMTLTLV